MEFNQNAEVDFYDFLVQIIDTDEGIGEDDIKQAIVQVETEERESKTVDNYLSKLISKNQTKSLDDSESFVIRHDSEDKDMKINCKTNSETNENSLNGKSGSSSLNTFKEYILDTTPTPQCKHTALNARKRCRKL